MIGVYPVRNSSPAIAGLETERGIISNQRYLKFPLTLPLSPLGRGRG